MIWIEEEEEKKSSVLFLCEKCRKTGISLFRKLKTEELRAGYRYDILSTVVLFGKIRNWNNTALDTCINKDKLSINSARYRERERVCKHLLLCCGLGLTTLKDEAHTKSITLISVFIPSF